jgi:hypothetical protein
MTDLQTIAAGDFDTADAIRTLATILQAHNACLNSLEDQIDNLKAGPDSTPPPQDQAPKPTARARAPKEK